MSDSIPRRYLFLTGVVALLALNLFLAVLLWRQLQAAPPEPPPLAPAVTSTAQAPTPTMPVVAPTKSATAAPASTASATSPALTATAKPTLTPLASPTETPSDAAATMPPSPQATVETLAVVRAQQGLNLRDAPDGRVLELLPDGALVTVLPDQERVNGTLWQRVRSAEGREGWVAVRFLEVQPE